VVQQVMVGLKAIYLSGWQVAADAKTGGEMYPDQSLYPVDSVPNIAAASTTRSAAATRSRLRTGKGARRTTWRRSSPMPKRGSAAR
jgi:isocitrate lyase